MSCHYILRHKLLTKYSYVRFLLQLETEIVFLTKVYAPTFSAKVSDFWKWLQKNTAYNLRESFYQKKKKKLKKVSWHLKMDENIIDIFTRSSLATKGKGYALRSIPIVQFLMRNKRGENSIL